MFDFKSVTNPFQKKEPLGIPDVREPLLPKSLLNLFLYSTFTFVFSALLLQFLIILQTAILLHNYRISFIYNLFGISFTSESSVKWPETRIFIVYGLGMLVFFGAGLFLLFLLDRLKHLHWKIRLTLTWLAFMMVHTLPLGMLAGIYLFDGFGIAFTWLLDNILLRALFAFIALVIMMAVRYFWMLLFLRAAYSTAFFSQTTNRAIFLKTCVILPWLAGTILLLPFVVYHQNWSWLIFIAGLGLVLLPIFRNNIPIQNFRIDRFDKKIFTMKYPILWFLITLTVVWAADFLSKTVF